MPELTDDFDGGLRPIGPGQDIGADEYSAPKPDKTNLRWLMLLRDLP